MLAGSSEWVGIIGDGEGVGEGGVIINEGGIHYVTYITRPYPIQIEGELVSIKGGILVRVSKYPGNINQRPIISRMKSHLPTKPDLHTCRHILDDH